MRRGTLLSVLFASLPMLVVSPGVATAAVVPAPKGAVSPVIVLLADQHKDVTATSAIRRSVTHADQRPLIEQARRLGARKVKQFSVVNGFAATLTAAAQAGLASDPRVLAVVPDRPVRLAGRPTAGTSTHAKRSAPLPGTCPADPAKPLLEPEALQLTHTAYLDRSVPQAQNLATGKGVKVGYIADGVDIHDPDFIRPDGSPVFVDYQDFSGEGVAGPSDGTEAFADASAIAAQGRQTYDLSGYVNPASPLPAGCTVQIRGMAPDASLVGLKIEGQEGFATTSTIVQGIDYAVNVAKVDVLNESVGFNPYPDTHTDPFSLANQAAVRAGVTVVAASGDAGFNGTVGDPAGDPSVISVGASTAFRIFAQTQRNMPGLTGWDSDHLSSVSSGGVTEEGQVNDLLAPGDGGWALCSRDVTLFTGCTNFNGQPSPFIDFGGTSQSAPLTAGAAALVIQAYRQAHNGASPAPALVKQILTSTAINEGDPADQQGAGLLNAYEAVQAALSIPDQNGHPAPQGEHLLLHQTQLSATANPGTSKTLRLDVTNIGAHTQTVSARDQVLGTTVSDQTGSLRLDTTTSPTWTSGSGNTFGFATRRFTVPAGADQLTVSIADPPADGHPVNVRLLDPGGALAAYTDLQGTSGFGRVDVHTPRPGNWTAIFDSRVPGGFNGTVRFDFRTVAATTVGAVTPASLTLAPGRTGTFHVRAATPADPGDLTETVRLGGGAHEAIAVPLVLRSLIPSGGGRFSGVLTGGNGRRDVVAQNTVYRFDIARGVHDFGINLALTGNPGQVVTGYLLAPDGQLYSQQNNVASFDDEGNPTRFTASLQEFRRDPMPGRWTFIVAVSNPVAGTMLAQQFSGELRLNTVDVTSTDVPAVIPAGTATTVQVRVHNTGIAAEPFFVDARSTTRGDLRLLGNGPETGLPLPHAGPVFYTAPTETTRLTATVTATAPVQADLLAGTVAPEALAGSSAGNVATASLTSPEVQPGTWLLLAELVGPFPPGGSSGSADFSLVAHTQLFDPTVTSSTGDRWLGTIQNQPPFSPLVLAPGQTGTIPVTITPTAPKGTRVSGVLYVDDFTEFNNTGDELKAIPYTYTVG
jgi:hypothetical protein